MKFSNFINVEEYEKFIFELFFCEKLIKSWTKENWGYESFETKFDEKIKWIFFTEFYIQKYASFSPLTSQSIQAYNMLKLVKSSQHFPKFPANFLSRFSPII